MILEAMLMKLLVTVTPAGKPPIVELLPREFAITDSAKKCHEAAEALYARRLPIKGVEVRVLCVPALTRGA